tara:strand:+ start:1004 stop:1903 length:900 start_codon:yes stop_codon:yes gene_type:complete
MTTRTLAFAGNKQSGKTTCSNFIHGYQLRCYKIINDFAVTKEGELMVQTEFIGQRGEKEQGCAILDTKRSDLEFSEWAVYNMWPYVKSYSFADPLKNIATELFDIKEENIRGTDIQKNAKIPITWQSMPGVVTCPKSAKMPEVKKLINKGVLIYHKPGKMTGREFLQFFGSEVCRKIYEEIWVARLVKDVDSEGSLLAVIDDCRYPNEATAIQDSGGRVIKLTRSNHEDSHKSENAFGEDYNFDAVIDNENLSIQETNVEIIKLIEEWGWLSPVLPDKETPNRAEPQEVGGIHTFKGVE